MSTRGVAPFFRQRPRAGCWPGSSRTATPNLSTAPVALQVDQDPLHRLLRRDRLRSDAADRMAVTLDRHPSELWPQWFADERVSR